MRRRFFRAEPKHYESMEKIRAWLTGNKGIQISNDLRDLLIGVWHDRLAAKAIVVSYLATRNFGVVRFPTRPDRSVDGEGKGYAGAAELLDSYSDTKLTALAKELAEVTRQTQSILSHIYSGNDIVLQRAVAPLDEKGGQYIAANRQCDQIELFPMLAMAAKQAGVCSICLDFDIVSGWSTTSLQRYGTLHITKAWPISDILLVSDLLAGPSGSTVGPLESNEWLCVNRNPRGVIEIKTSDLKVVDLPERYVSELRSHKAVADLANELQRQAHIAPTERNIALRPPLKKFPPTYRKIPPQSFCERLRSWIIRKP
ncbi:hypothetical protein [Azospira inquinata]|uniref:Uncharacterized protein n=1 Tax=Azospira inquinata TaxID=2785627 RepID=A0A975XUM8_9RHOO|nr:hypothetical protein [Azospira inquinata]QWT45727.1 hypothetical protein J8L76_12435 [Azospira inquinata]QWT48949.1 hypothetical protein Azoinq_14175 [Azospira inquinata]